LQGPSVTELGAHLLEKIAANSASKNGEPSVSIAETGPLPDEAERLLLSQLDEMSDTDIDTLLSQLLAEEVSDK
jgi:hypothetical protein